VGSIYGKVSVKPGVDERRSTKTVRI